MLLPDNIHPEKSIYYNGAIVLQVIQKQNGLDLVSLFHEVKQVNNVSFPVYILCLDWLYIVNIAEVKEGRVVLCS